MKIIYKNRRGKNYATFDSQEFSYRSIKIIGSSEKTSDELIEIPIYDTEENIAPVYLELVTLDPIDFSNKYGVLVSPSLTPPYDEDTHSYLFSDSLKRIYEPHVDKNYYECMFGDVYDYYRAVMQCLITINQLLKRLPKDTFSIVRSLSKECYRITTVPSFDAIIGTQYVNPDDSDKYEKYFTVNPYTHILYKIEELSPCSSTLDFSSCFNNPEMGYIFNKIFNSYHNHEDIEDTFLEKYQLQIVNLAKFLFSNALSNEIRDIYPLVNYDQSVLLNEWYFPTLASALFYSFYLDYSSSLIIARCANEYCNKLFTYRKTRKTRKYCCPTCGHNVADRKYMRKRAQQNAENS